MTEYELCNIYTSNIRWLRTQQGMSQFELAEKADLSDKYISYIETGRQWGSIETLLKLANALGVEPFQLLQPNGTVVRSKDNALTHEMLNNLRADFSSVVDILEKLIMC